MKIFVTLVLLCMLSGCVTDVSHEPPHNKLIGTVWRLKTDAYVIRFNDQRNQLYIIPNTKEFGGYLRDYSIEGKPYDEKNIGRKIVGEKIVGGLRVGELLEVVRILKTSSMDMGTSYWPMMVPLKENKWTASRELNGEDLYYGRDGDGQLFYEQGVLNPEYAEVITVETTSPQGAEAGSGSEESGD